MDDGILGSGTVVARGPCPNNEWDMMAEIYDLVIVGAGPAGATAALYAHRHGLTTCLVDKATFSAR